MKLFVYLFKTSRAEIVVLASLGVAGGVASAGLIAVVNSALHHPVTSRLGAAFAAVAIVKIGCALASSLLLARMSHNSVLRLCDELCVRIIEAPFAELERVGASSLFALLTDDIYILSSAIQTIPALIVNVAILGGCAAYLTYLSWSYSLATLGFIVAGAIGYKLLLARAYTAIRLAREGRDTLFRHFRSLTDGIKELKLNSDRRRAFLTEEIGVAIEYLREQNLAATNRYVFADGWSQLMFYMLLAGLLFFHPGGDHLASEQLSAYIFAALYAAAPIWGIIGASPTFARGKDSLERLEHIGLTIEPEESSGEAPPRADRQFEIAFRGVEFSYPDTASQEGFKLGPLDLTLRPGELVFVVGGNGSGKSTFVKLLTGLYLPDAGRIEMDGELLTTGRQEHYRQCFSAVYSDFYLFDRIFNARDRAVQAAAKDYLEVLELSHKVTLDGERLSTTKLSQGQRRRLALLAAYLEDRPVMVLDEWAADQDPSYRRIFYTRVLPELKQKGKTVVVVTHDDRYFHVADRLLKLDYGTLIENSLAQAPAAEPFHV